MPGNRINVRHPENCLLTAEECFTEPITISELSYFLPDAAAVAYCNMLKRDAELWVSKPPVDSSTGASRCNSVCIYRRDIKL